MDGEMVSKFHRHGSTFVGAILMSNRTTKQECLQRKLFGMPSSWAWHITQIKAGMLLFLFEHEERKLYGVFEAASDGAMNIMPNAFLSSGNSFPAQILFKRIWMCKPLSEDEFSYAIKDNYVARKRFKFGLSYDQAHKLIQLFSLKRINVRQYQRPAIPNEIIEEFERFGGNKVRVIGGGGSTKIFSDEYSADDDIGSQSYRGSSRSNIDHIFSVRKQPLSVNSERQPYQRASQAVEARPPCYLGYQFKPPHLMGSTSPNDRSISGNISKCLKYGYHARGMCYYPLPQKLIACVGSSSDTQPHQINTQSYTSNIGTRPLHHCPRNLIGTSMPACDTCNVSLLPAVSSECHLNYQDYKHESHTEPYDPADPRISFSRRMPKAKGTDSFPSAHTSNFHGHPEASTHKCDFEEQRCGALRLFPDYVPLVGTNCVHMNLISSYFNSPSKDISGNYSSESMEDDELHGMQPCLATRSEEYYPTVDSRLHSDTEQSRISVFSRLSKARKGCRVPKSEEAFHKRGAQKTLNRFSLDHLARILSQKREQLIETKKVSKHSSIHDDVKKFERKVVMEPNMTTFPGELERNNDAFDEDGIAEDAIVEESSERLLLNSKRKSGILSLSGENQMNVDADSGLDEDTSQEYKRRKLLRASASEEECGNIQGLLPEMVIKTMIENNATSIKTCEITPPNYFDTDNKNSSASEASLGDVISDKREVTTRSLNNLRKEVSNRNLRWFLQKSINTLSKESNVDHVYGETKDASHVVVDDSVLPVNNKHGNEEICGITGDEKMYCRL